jgi:hypothetical protein
MLYLESGRGKKFASLRPVPEKVAVRPCLKNKIKKKNGRGIVQIIGLFGEDVEKFEFSDTPSRNVKWNSRFEKVCQFSELSMRITT